MHPPGPAGLPAVQTGLVRMDPEVLALIEQADTGLRRLLPDVRRQPGSWEDQARVLLALQEVAKLLVEASRRYAEQLSREAGEQ
jgi:hypothetical protein